MMSTWEKHSIGYLIEDILRDGERKNCRNGMTQSLFGKRIHINLMGGGLPVIQGRRLYYSGVFGELSAMLAGATTVKEFQEHGCNYWDKWADKDGNLVLDYGTAWRDFNGVDQLKELRSKLKNEPNDRRMIISTWRPDRLHMLSLPCCHFLYQWHVSNGCQLNMVVYQRSVDVMIGLPSDILFAAAWNIILAKEAGLDPGNLTFMMGDTHIYAEHLQAAKLYLDRLNQNVFESVRYTLKTGTTVDNFDKDSITLLNYSPLEAIKMEVKL
ncbi:MAG: thymidylate synthase [Gammaproteobacteria bacterium]|nr:thymidylate synthase [Gammaproteobacteria bacterium]